MSTAVVPVTLGKGVNRDQPPWELELGVWSACANMRFRAGLDERVGGVTSVYTPSVTPYAMGVFDVGVAAGTTRFVVAIGLTKAYVWDGTTETEITRGLYGTIASMTGAGATVTATTSGNHGLSTGDNVIISGVVPTGYNTPITGASITVTGATTFTYSNSTTSAVTTQGRWESNRTSNFGGTAGDEFSVFTLNGILYVNLPFDGLHYWGGNTAGGAQGKLRRILATGQNTYVYGRTARAFKDYVFVLGYQFSTNTTSALLAKKPYTIAWGASAEPGTIPTTFTAAATNDAGSVQKTRGALVDACEMNGLFYIYHERAILEVSYTGGSSVFSLRYINEADGLLAPNCLVNIPEGQAFVTQGYDLKVHSGGLARSVAEGRMWQWIKENISTTNAGRSFMAVNRRFNEVNLFIPTTGNTNPNKCLIWTYEGDTWGERSVTDVTCGVAGMLPTSVATDDRLLIANTTPAVGLVDSGTTYFGNAYTSSCERTGMHFDAQGVKKIINRSRIYPDMGSAQTASVYHGSHKLQEESASYASAVTYTHNTTRDINAYAPTAAEYAAFKIETTAASYRLRKFELHVNSFGNY